MTTTSLNEQDFIKYAHGIISRRNQDETIIIMDLKRAELFHKIDGYGVLVWQELKHSRKLIDLINHFVTLFPEKAVELKTGINELVNFLYTNELITISTDNSKEAFITRLEDGKSLSTFGEFKTFSFEEIETEILNESLYLDVFAGSDLRLKTDVTPLDGALNKILKLEGIKFFWDSSINPNASQSPQVGIIAQQVAEQMPELVRRDEQSGYLGVNYVKMTSYLIEAMKELHHQVEDQKNKIANLESKLNGISQ